jgi:hypothetical protein
VLAFVIAIWQLGAVAAFVQCSADLSFDEAVVFLGRLERAIVFLGRLERAVVAFEAIQ